MHTFRHALVPLAASFLAAGSLQAAMLTVVNNSFEQSTGYNGGNPTTVTGWQAPPNQGTYGQTANVTSLFTFGLSGNNAIYFGGQIGQLISATYQAGQTYTISIDVGNPNNVGADGAGFNFGFRNTANSGFLSGGSQFIGDYNINPIPDGTFQTFTFTYTATAADNGNGVRIGFDDFYYSPTDGTPSYYVDNVTLSTSAAVVPEPSTYACVFFGLAALACARRRLQHRA